MYLVLYVPNLYLKIKIKNIKISLISKRRGDGSIKAMMRGNLWLPPGCPTLGIEPGQAIPNLLYNE